MTSPSIHIPDYRISATTATGARVTVSCNSARAAVDALRDLASRFGSAVVESAGVAVAMERAT